MPLTDFISSTDQQRIVAAIGAAELQTSGEIRVHIEPKCKEADPIKRAASVFNSLGMAHTRQRNGVLIYLAYKSRKFAIIGDCGINDRVPENFWDTERNTLLQFLIESRPADGICKIIEQIGEKLAEFFPYTDDDINEQSDEISYSE